MVYYGSDGAGGWQSLERPLRTLTTLDRFGLVTWDGRTAMLRMLQAPELKRAMGLDDKYRIEQGTRRDRIRLLGNGVCPPVMEAVVRSLARGEMTVGPTPAKRRNHWPFRSEPPGAHPALPETALLKTLALD